MIEQRKSDREFLDLLERIGKELAEDNSVLNPENVFVFQKGVKNAREQIEVIKKEGRRISVGIIGCVKAGKSTFLNALLFGGEEVLPRAATPMTASLTRISYSEKPKAKVVFYKSYDWKNIENFNQLYEKRIDDEIAKRKEENAKAAGKKKKNGLLSVDRETVERQISLELPDKYKSCHELIKMVKENRLNVDDYLGKAEEIEIDSKKPLGESLKEYVGATGRYTPIVNYIELEVDNPLLQDLVVVDTPGLNDPITSRGERTKDFLEACDVVFIVSNMSQFLPEEDINMIVKNIGDTSIQRAYVIGSQLDSALRQQPRSLASIQTAFDNCCISAGRRFRDEIDQASRIRPDSVLLQELKKTSPEFVSAMAFGIAAKQKKGIRLEKDELNVITNLEKRFSDFHTVIESPDDLAELANIEGVRKRVLEKVRSENRKIAEGKLQDYKPRTALSMAKNLERMEEECYANLKMLRTGDMETLGEKLKLLEDNLDSIRSNIRNIFEGQDVQCRKQIQSLKTEIAGEMSAHDGLEIGTRTRTEMWTEQYGLFGLFKRTNREVVRDDVADVSQVVKLISGFGARVMEMINEQLDNIFDIKGLSDQIKGCVLGAFDLSDDKFDRNEILLPLENAMTNLTVYEVEFDFMDEISETIYNAFPNGQAVNEEIHCLRQLQEKEMRKVLKIFCQKLDETADNISANMNEQAAVFVDSIQKKISVNIEHIRRLLDNREENVREYEAVISRLRSSRQALVSYAGKEKG